MTLVERLFLAAGAVLFAALVIHIGPATLLADLALVGAGFSLIFGQELFAILFNTLGWRYAIRPDSRQVAFVDLLAMRRAGDAVNYVTPSAAIGGEVVKARLLLRRIATTDAMGSVSLAAITQFLSQIVFIVAAAPFVAARASSPIVGDLALGVGAAVVLICAVLVYLGRRQDAFRRIRAFLVRRGWFERWTRRESDWRALDAAIFGAFRDRPVDTVLSVLWFTLGWAMGAVEIYLILYFLGLPAGWSDAIAIEGLSMLVDLAFFYVPAKIGTQESGKYAIFLLLGLNPAGGLTLGVVRRLREMGWALLGLLALGYYQRPGTR
ncbi:MAG: lysylphosphatidylglycerol synthase transmembrane domain-containing protein [Candidatus Eiseniibacteriota bacterium]